MITLYASPHGKTKQVAKKFDINAKHISEDHHLDGIVVFFCPTYGDEELPIEMEDYIVNLKATNRLYALCELGNYYGYDDFEFGAAKIISHKLRELNWKPVIATLSLDALPSVDWENFYRWKNEFYNRVR